MGPRSCERGNTSHAGHPQIDAAVLQWGRARASAEMGGYAHAREPQPHTASMGPRSCERGNWETAGLSRTVSLGFNGAALVRARKYVARSFSVCVHFACFNGAALVRARKFGRERCGYSIVVCASMGPRSCERGNDADQELVRRYCEQLQWGRARASAEIATFVSVAFPRHLASMGPRSCERGNGHCAWPPQPCAGLLQWGRARASAEMGGRRTTSTKPPGSLQWGRARASAEMEREQWRAREIARLLQWGRARASAEI